jgi:hypothetical protein
MLVWDYFSVSYVSVLSVSSAYLYMLLLLSAVVNADAVFRGLSKPDVVRFVTLYIIHYRQIIIYHISYIIYHILYLDCKRGCMRGCASKEGCLLTPDSWLHNPDILLLTPPVVGLTP